MNLKILKRVLLIGVILFLIFEFGFPLILPVCGSWSPFSGESGITCRCLGKVLKSGGNITVSGDMGGKYVCRGLYLPKL